MPMGTLQGGSVHWGWLKMVKIWLEDLRQLRHFESASQFCEITDMIWVERVERSFVSSFF